jgi:hypothetical protein
MSGASASATCETSYRLPFDSVYTGQAAANVPDFTSTTGPDLLSHSIREQARRFAILSYILTDAERFSIDAKLDRLLTSRRCNTPLSVAPASIGTTLRSSFILSLSTISAQSAPGATKTIANAPLSPLMALDTTTGTTTRSLPIRHDSTAPYSASPNALFSSRVRSSGTGEGYSAEQAQALCVCVATIGFRRDPCSNDHPRSDTGPRRNARFYQDVRPCTDRHPQKVCGLQESDDQKPSCAQSVVPDF